MKSNSDIAVSLNKKLIIMEILLNEKELKEVLLKVLLRLLDLLPDLIKFNWLTDYQKQDPVKLCGGYLGKLQKEI